MIAWATKANSATAISWEILPVAGREMPYEANLFDAVVASSVFEYLADLEMTLAELWRILKPGGCLIYTVPNTRHRVRKLEGLLRPVVKTANRMPLLKRVKKLNSYATYLRCSRNRMPLDEWFALGRRMQFTAIEPDKSRASKNPLVFLVFQKNAGLSG
jgi:ubiquinone/menaquinone biosynthesis C-methylase UbiE